DLCANFFGQNRLKGTLYDGESRLTMPDGSFLAMYSMGGLAEYCVTPAASLTKVPEGLDPENAAIIGCAGLTSYAAVFRQGEVAEDMSVAIIGVGGIGSSLIPFAREAGASRIIAVDIAKDKLDRSLELGATDAVNSREVDAVAEIRRITETGVDVAFEALGN